VIEVASPGHSIKVIKRSKSRFLFERRFIAATARLALLSLVAPAACAGHAQVQLPGTSGQPDAAAPGPEPDNGALTPELQSTQISLDSVLAGLGASDAALVCQAIGKWRFRLAPQLCLAFVQSAVILQPRSEAEDRALCAENLKICGAPPTEPTPACTTLPDTCTVTLRELDQCYADRERAYLAIPSCELMTRAQAPSAPGAPSDQPSCVKLSAECNNVL
jgi:hypothetical protein